MSINIHSNYYQDNLEKIDCLDCDRSFIVGEYLCIIYYMFSMLFNLV